MTEVNWRDDPLENTPPVLGSGDFLRDRGYPDPVETRVKFDLAIEIRQIYAERNLRQADLVRLVTAQNPAVGFSQPDASKVLRGNVKGYSVERLLEVVAAMGNRVTIQVEPVSGAGSIRVVGRKRDALVAA